jgi:hypothetical protein
VFLPLATPEVVLGAALLGWFLTLTFARGFVTVIIAHVMFTLGYVVVTIRARLEGMDLHIEEVTGADKSLDVVVDIFNRVNSGGTKLSKGDLALPPARGFAILTCMDARLDPAKYAGLSEGDAHVIRNAGGRASDDAIRSLVISHKLLGTKEWFVIHHPNCGMELFCDSMWAVVVVGAVRCSSAMANLLKSDIKQTQMSDAVHSTSDAYCVNTWASANLPLGSSRQHGILPRISPNTSPKSKH